MRDWKSMFDGDEFEGSNGCQICGGLGQNYRLSFDAGIVHLCVEHRAEMDLLFLELDCLRTLTVAGVEVAAVEAVASTGQVSFVEARHAFGDFAIQKDRMLGEVTIWCAQRKAEIDENRAAKKAEEGAEESAKERNDE